MVRVAVEVPEAFLAPILGDLQQRHATVLEVEAVGDQRRVLARAALSRLMAYSTAVRSLSQGQAAFDVQPDGLAAASSGPGA